MQLQPLRCRKCWPTAQWTTRRFPHRTINLLLALFIVPSAVVLVTLLAQPVSGFEEQFEGPNTTWHEWETDTNYRLIRHHRSREAFHSGASSEYVEVLAGNGSYIHFAHEIDPARIIDELRPSVWVKANRPGPTILARIVLPHARYPESGEPVTVQIVGPAYKQTGSWQKLELSNLPELLTRQIRALRTSFGPELDSREAYIDQVLINVYGGEGSTQIYIDDLKVAGEVQLKDVVTGASGGYGKTGEDQWQGAKNSASQIPTYASSSATTADEWTKSDSSSEAVQPAAWNESGSFRDTDRMSLQGTRLMLGGHAVLPRIIQYQGESVETLKNLGFNMIWLESLADDQLLADVARTDMWIICPAPGPAAISSGALTEKYNRVAAWNLGLNRTGQDIDNVRTWAQQIHTKDPVIGRPILIGCHDELRAFSRVADVVMVGRNPIGSTLSMTEFARDLAAQPRLARPGTPLWVQVPTEPEAALLSQWSALAQAGQRDPADAAGNNETGIDTTWRVVPPGAGITPQQLRTVLYTALAAGSRGFLFHSRSSLDSNDRETHRRRAMLELLNLELSLIEPWAAGGSFVTSAPSGDPELFGVAMQTDRARLLLPVRTGPLDQFVAEPLGWHARAFIVPGVPDSNDAFELTPSGLRPLVSKRVTGGIRIFQEAYAGGAMVVMSSDPRIASNLTRQISKINQRAAELKRELALTEQQNTESIERRLPASANPRDVAELLSTSRTALEQSRTYLAARDWRRSYEKSEMAIVILGRLQRRRWQEIVSRWPSVIASPAATNYAVLPIQTEFMQCLEAARVDPNAMAGGDIESLNWMLENGWRHYLRPQPGIGSDVELSPAAPHSGKYALRLRAWSDQQTDVTAPVETSPVWVTSAPVRVQQGDLLRIRGFVRVPKEPAGSVDGLMVIDSLSGIPLAERIHQTKGWQEFTLFRAAAQTGEMTVTFALSGLGEAFIDDITVETIRFDQPPAPAIEPNVPQEANLRNLLGLPGMRR